MARPSKKPKMMLSGFGLEQENQLVRDNLRTLAKLWGYRAGPNKEHTDFELETHKEPLTQGFTDPIMRLGCQGFIYEQDIKQAADRLKWEDMNDEQFNRIATAFVENVRNFMRKPGVGTAISNIINNGNSNIYYDLVRPLLKDVFRDISTRPNRPLEQIRNDAEYMKEQYTDFLERYT